LQSNKKFVDLFSKMVRFFSELTTLKYISDTFSPTDARDMRNRLQHINSRPLPHRLAKAIESRRDYYLIALRKLSNRDAIR